MNKRKLLTSQILLNKLSRTVFIWVFLKGIKMYKMSRFLFPQIIVFQGNKKKRLTDYVGVILSSGC